jgi:hypothetical protein
MFYYGQLGSGKTLHAVFDCYLAHRMGRRIITNARLKHIPHTPFDLHDIVNEVYNPVLETREPKFLFLDEISTICDSWNLMSRQNKIVSDFFVQIRKRNIDMVYTTAFISGAVNRLRELTDILVRCEAVKHPDGSPRKFKFHWVDVAQMRLLGREGNIIRHGTQTWPLEMARLMYPYYDTTQVIVPQEMT